MNKAEEIFKAEMSYIERSVAEVESLGHVIADLGRDLVANIERLDKAVADAAEEMGESDPVAQRETEANARNFPRVQKDLKNAVNLAITVAENTVNNAGLNVRIPYVR